MTKYINLKQYTDVKSWQVYDIDEAKGTAMAIEVEKHITPNMVPGGFSAICTNNGDFDRTGKVTPVEGAQPFAITRNKNGVWGYRRDKVLCSMDIRAVRDVQEILDTNPAAEVVGNCIVWFDRTPKGARKTTFEKLGVLDDTCRYFYDYNF